MSELHNFYQSLLNLRQKDETERIKEIVLEEKQKLTNQTTDLTGFCKYIASQIEYRLNQLNIHTYWIDLKDIIQVDHVILIAEYMTNNKLKRILIDPTYNQFTKNSNYKLVKLKEWPSEKLDSNILNSLLTEGIIEIDDNKFINYINSFTDKNLHISLDSYLMTERIGKKFKR